jgi:glycosyltransferase involved in cell wall biosynthesis
MTATVAGGIAERSRTVECPDVRVVMIGPGLNVRGGISNGQRLLIEALPADVRVTHIASMIEGSKLRKLLRFIGAALDLRRTLRGDEVVHIHFASGASSRRKMILARIAKRRGARVIMHARGGGYRDYWGAMSSWERAYTLETLRMIDRLVVLGTGWRAFYAGIGVPESQLVIAPNPVKFPAAVPLRRPGATLCFVYLGLVIQRKGTFDLLNALARLSDALRARLRFVIAGNGELIALRRTAQHLGVDDCVEIREWLSPPERDDLLARADAFVLPSYMEGLPNALLEAMAWGLPCICTPVGAVPEFVRHDENGWLIAPGAVDELAEAIERLACDAPLRQRLGKAARATMEPFDIRPYARRMTELYRSLAPRSGA